MGRRFGGRALVGWLVVNLARFVELTCKVHDL